MKPAARLTASLLARKGQAKPAMGPRSTAHLAPHEPGGHGVDPAHGDDHIDPLAGMTAPDANLPDANLEANGEQPDAAPASHPALPDPAPAPDAEADDQVGDNATPGNPEADVIERALQRGRAHAEEGDFDEHGEPAPADFAAAAQPMHATPATTSRPDRRPVGSGARIAMTVRLDHERHHRLRVLSAHLNKSSQEILVEALDKFLDKRSPEAADHGCTCLGTASCDDQDGGRQDGGQQDGEQQADAGTDTENNAGESPNELDSGSEG